MSSKFTVFPLDDRPCSTIRISELLAIAGREALFFDGMKTFRDPKNNFSYREEWLKRECSRCDSVLISVDGWLYGGLVESRRFDFDKQVAAARLLDLEKWIIENPNTKFYFSNTLLRLSITLDENHSKEVWKTLFDYSVEKDKVELGLGSSELLNRLESQLDEKLLKNYLETRKRNAWVNKRLLDFAQYKNVCSILFGQEDCHPFGLHRPEKLHLKKAIEKLPLSSRKKVHLMTGTDELMAMNVFLAYRDEASYDRIEIAVKKDFDWTQVSRYEDVSVEENLNAHLLALGMKISEDGIPIFIHGFKDKQADLCFETPESIFERNSSHPKWILDLRFANGADYRWLDSIEDRRGLEGVSAWNTSGNAMGTFFAQFGMVEASKKRKEFLAPFAKQYLEASLLDDGIYQGKIRGELIAYCHRNGIDEWNLKPQEVDLLTQMLEDRLRKCASAWGITSKVRAQFPWPRVFEIKLVFD